MYQERKFDLNISGLSESQIQAHLGLYSGYVKNTNNLIEVMKTAEGPALAETSRRFGFEFNGMRLHEYYFEQFEKGGEDSSKLKDRLAEQFGSFDSWKDDFVRIGKLRGIGWALLVEDDRTGDLMNVWISDHENGHLGGQKILLAMDIWEHAYLIDLMPSDRGKYIDIFFKNLNWNVIESRV